MRVSVSLLLLCPLVLLSACKKQEEPSSAVKPAETAAPKSLKVGLVTDVGGRGDQSFNDSALRGLELWASGKKLAGGRYVDATAEDIKATLQQDLLERNPPIAPVNVTPVVLQSKVPQDYEPNLQMLAEQGVSLAVGVGFMLENAVEAVAKQNPDMKFLLIDSPLVSGDNKPYSLPNVRTAVYREEEGSFLVGVLAGLASKSGKVGFVGGMEIALVKRCEAGFRAGVAATNPDAVVLANYTGSFDNVAMGKQVTQDLLAKGADVVYHAAGSDGMGVIQAGKEARAAGKQVYIIGVDSDQSHLAPDTVLTSMMKRVDLTVYMAARDLVQGTFKGEDLSLGLKEGGVTYAPVRVDFPGKAEALRKVEELREKVISGEIKVPTHPDQLTAAQPKKP